MSLDQLGGLVTKAVSVEPRPGAPSPRVAEFDGGMINAVGLANPGADEVKATELPWLARELKQARVIVNVIGRIVEDFGDVVARLDDAAGLRRVRAECELPEHASGRTRVRRRRRLAHRGRRRARAPRRAVRFS